MTQSYAVSTKIPGHPPRCKCVRCKVGVLDRAELFKIPLVGECQRCHKKLDNVEPGQPCIHCNFGGLNGQALK